ncbi:MAG: hypothetical protein KJO05_11940 [Bacteroidia bacterium]|nr:hypothetical protein [Bacteroidia bacterium]NNF31817.1 hypothetical protein [Flavobacteriaceae bacterium]MBT8276246.1 hypothetical protein [Bacteroidia bacterium]NNJ81192.1 hypothetical protein [Flavobacteriaceae bacterium]NNK53344.1 hypothetical protein [Flavobacteriaceae bacterium]
MKDHENSHLMDKVADALRKAAVEIEEFQVKSALGKAEAQDKYEEVKKKFNRFIHDSKSKMKTGKEKLDELHTKLDELRVQLALGKAESRDAFIEQKRKLLSLLHQIEVKIKTHEKLRKLYAILLIEIEIFKVQLEILEEKFEEGTEGAKAAFEKGKKEFNEFIENLKSKKAKEEETQWEHFQGEISEAFDHFKQAFKKA